MTCSSAMLNIATPHIFFFSKKGPMQGEPLRELLFAPRGLFSSGVKRDEQRQIDSVMAPEPS